MFTFTIVLDYAAGWVNIATHGFKEVCLQYPNL